MLHLAAADVLFVCVLPFKISYYFSGSDWRFGSAMCRFVTAAFYGNMYASIMLMTAISVDRFLAVVYPIQSLSWRTLGRASFICLAIWAMAIAGVAPLLLHHALEKEMATHFSVFAWRIPGTAEPGGLPSMGSQRVLAAAAQTKATTPLPNH